MRRQDELWHWGIKGMKWGVRRYQNKDGTLTTAGKKHYGEDGADGDEDSGWTDCDMKGRSCPGAAPSLHFGFAFFPTALLYRRPPGAPSFVARFFLPLYFSNALRGVIFLFFVFTGILFSVGPPGA